MEHGPRFAQGLRQDKLHKMNRMGKRPWAYSPLPHSLLPSPCAHGRFPLCAFVPLCLCAFLPPNS